MTTAPLIRLDGVTAGYPGREVLRDVSLTLRAGERLAVVGANGAGKSTLLQVITGLIPARAGTIEAFGAPRRTEADFRAVRARAGLVFQDPDDQLFCPTVVEDVAFGPANLGQTRRQSLATARATLAALGLGRLEDRITHRLSGGEKRLVSIAAVLAMQPDVLLLDEPTTGLDPDAYDRLSALLHGLPQAMIIIAHDAGFLASLATTALVLQDGRSRRATIDTHAHHHSHAHLHFIDDVDPRLSPSHPVPARVAGPAWQDHHEGGDGWPIGTDSPSGPRMTAEPSRHDFDRPRNRDA